jgi:type VI protein secretion system component VasK
MTEMMKHSGVVLLMAVLMISAYTFVIMWNTSRITDTQQRLKQIEELYKRSDDRWRKSDQDRWVNKLKELNPELKVPQ